MNWSIEQTELIEWLKGYDGPKFHAIVCDPPYALISITKRFGKEGSAPAQEGSDGRYSRLSGGFMGQQWDGFDSLEQYQDWVAEWSSLLIANALLPGAVCLFFGGTRTYHHLGVGLERGGFEIVDCLMWFHGQGFPKSHDISKFIDKDLGAEREDLGQSPNWRESKRDRERFGSMEVRGENAGRITKPATPEAEQWDGYGTALKPAWEPIFLCRAPRGDKTFAQLATEFGTGALNIDGSRISGIAPDTIQGQSEHQGKSVYNGEDQRDQRQFTGHESGRWPANFVLSHDEDCVKVGEFEVEGRTINRWTEDMKPFGGGAGEEYESEEMPPETVERWACVPSCPVRILDDQAGELTSGAMRPGQQRVASQGLGGYQQGFPDTASSRGAVGSAGGPSRFFYTSKASRGEKDKGLEDFYWKRVDKGFERIEHENWELLDKKERAKGNIHPTVKPLDMIRYLATLVLPPNVMKSDHSNEKRKWRILVPFSGSGSEIIGALQAGWDEAVGIEMEETYTEIAESRIVANVGYF